ALGIEEQRAGAEGDEGHGLALADGDHQAVRPDAGDGCVRHPIDGEEAAAALAERHGKNAVVEIAGENALHFEARGVGQAQNGERVLVIVRKPELLVGRNVEAGSVAGHRGRDGDGANGEDAEGEAPVEAAGLFPGFARHQSGPSARRRSSTFSPACQTLPAPSVSTRSPSAAAATSASTPRSMVPTYSTPRCPNWRMRSASASAVTPSMGFSEAA